MARQRSGQQIGQLNWQVEQLAGQGKYREALELARKVSEFARRQLGDHLDTAISINNLGYLLGVMEGREAARPYYEEALAIRRRWLGADHPDTAESLDDLGALLRAMGELAAARPFFEEALAIRRRRLGDDHLGTAASLTHLGLLLQAQGELAEALPYFEQALATVRRVLGDDHSDVASSLNNLGLLRQDMGDLAEARPYYEQALDIKRRRRGDGHPDTAVSLNNLAALEAGSGRINEAAALMRQAAAIDGRLIGQVFSVGSDQERLLFLRQIQVNQDGFLSLVSRHLPGSSEAVGSALALVLCRKALGAEALAAQRDAILGGRYPHLREAFDRLNQLRQRITEKVFAGPAPGETVAVHEQTLHDWGQEQQQREMALARQIPEMNLDQQLQKGDRRAVALALPEGIALVEFVRFHVCDFHAVPARGEPRWQPARYLAFVLLAQESDNVRMLDLGEADTIDQMIADFRAGITLDPSDRRRGTLTLSPEPSAAADQGTALRAAVFDPLRNALGGRTRLLLCPDGDLARLPFEVLPAPGGGRLIDTYQISYLTSGRDVLRFGVPATGQPAPPLVAADPDFDLDGPVRSDPLQRVGGADDRRNAVTTNRCSRDLDRSQPADRLPGTREEGRRVAELLGVQPWLDASVLEARLKEQRSPRVLHLATHGFFLRDQPHEPDGFGILGRPAGTRLENPLLRSGLLLAGFNTWRTGGSLPAEAEDGMLTAEDVTGMDLLDTELVVLSACETGLGQVHAGEGVFGLRRAFVLAGAKTLVMSLWKVPDDATQELMVDFYTRILAGEPRAEALRQAQLTLKRKYPDPFFWGAFICQGDPGPLRS